MEIEYIEEDDPVIVPWGENAGALLDIGAVEQQEDEEGLYSEDEEAIGRSHPIPLRVMTEQPRSTPSVYLCRGTL